MSFFNKMFGSKMPIENTTSQNNPIIFGRYTDKGKTKKQLDHWYKSVDDFEAKNYFSCFSNFLNYIKDEQVDNVQIEHSAENVLHFEIIQGSKILKGKASQSHFEAECPLVKMNTLSTPVMRKLMTMNYNLLYSKFAMNDDIIYMKFSSNAIDASPYKLYDALKEMARNADKQDDLLLTEFSSLTAVYKNPIIELPFEIIEIKYKYLVQWIKETLTEIEKLDKDKFSGGISFLLLNLIYKIDYLIVPEGVLTDKIESMQTAFFAKDELTTMQKNQALLVAFEEILQQDKATLTKGFYHVKATFPIVNPANRKDVMDRIYAEKDKINWYKDNNYPFIVYQMYQYVFGYSFFDYGMDKPDRQLLDFLFQLYNLDFYAEMGFPNVYIQNGVLNQKEITNKLSLIVKAAQQDFPYLNINYNYLKFTDLTAFTESIFAEMDIMNYTIKQ